MNQATKDVCESDKTLREYYKRQYSLKGGLVADGTNDAVLSNALDDQLFQIVDKMSVPFNLLLHLCDQIESSLEDDETSRILKSESCLIWH